MDTHKNASAPAGPTRLPYLRRGSRLGKYKVLRKLGQGGFADVYEALDTIEGSRVAVKIPHTPLMTKEVLADFYREVRLAARLDHPGILALKNADFVDGRFVIVTALGIETLADRLRRRISVRTAMSFAEQMLEAVAFAHEHRIIHCDIKPANLILFPDQRLRLTDFGIAKVAFNTVQASGSGTVGFVAPEQAMGKPSQRSDVFSSGLILYRLFSGHLPEWPFEWPPPGHTGLKRKLPPEMMAFLRKAIEVAPGSRFRDGAQMLAAFRRLKPLVSRFSAARSRSGRRTGGGSDWRTVRTRQFQRRFGKALATRHHCSRCEGPVSEPMRHCPWCGAPRRAHRGKVSFPARCPRCHRGMKLDWRFCAWCYGAGFEPHGSRSYSDVRYTARCPNQQCSRKELMPYMRYCPWCRRKVRRAWSISGTQNRCRHCRWGVVREFWSYCPWCSRSLDK